MTRPEGTHFRFLFALALLCTSRASGSQQRPASTEQSRRQRRRPSSSEQSDSPSRRASAPTAIQQRHRRRSNGDPSQAPEQRPQDRRRQASGPASGPAAGAVSRHRAATATTESSGRNEQGRPLRRPFFSRIGSRYSGLTPAAGTAGTHLSIEALSWAASARVSPPCPRRQVDGELGQALVCRIGHRLRPAPR